MPAYSRNRSRAGVERVKLLWVNDAAHRLREAHVQAFAQVCDVCEIDSSELPGLDRAEDWDLVCFNFDFPDMSSLKLVPETKLRWPSVPIILLTMQNSADLSLWALRSRVFDLLVKPVQTQEITRCMQRVNEVLQARRSQTGRRPQSAVNPLPAEARYHAKTSASERLQLALAHISKNFPRALPESEVARLCDMTPARFCREFKATFGETFLECLSRQRITAAKRLLGNPGMSVTDVAASVGFTDPSYFTRVFRKQQGISPSEYRSQALTDHETGFDVRLRSA
jgi:YesN/AraC family two-component response regulator